mmetsp:Transcript_7059/g.31886  ORF Transcript_7059/g.31886 Transcript_7059/m.31886 type:complete len:287 (-) Transcript_7059:2192-3052(-)
MVALGRKSCMMGKCNAAKSSLAAQLMFRCERRYPRRGVIGGELNAAAMIMPTAMPNAVVAISAPHPPSLCAAMHTNATNTSIQAKDLTPCLPETSAETGSSGKPVRGAPARTHSFASARPNAPRRCSSSTLQRIASHRCEELDRSSPDAMVFTGEPSYSFAASDMAARKCSRSSDATRTTSRAARTRARCNHSHAITTAWAKTVTTFSLAVSIECCCRRLCGDDPYEYACATVSGGVHETRAGVPTTMPALPVTHASGSLLATSAERVASSASLIAFCLEMSPKMA